MKLYAIFKPNDTLNMYDVIYDLHGVYDCEELANQELLKINDYLKNSYNYKEYSAYIDTIKLNKARDI